MMSIFQRRFIIGLQKSCAHEHLMKLLPAGCQIRFGTDHVGVRETPKSKGIDVAMYPGINSSTLW